ncbi:transposase family protein [Actinomadura sp. 9N215]|uniref:transposase family protein n=1 Tax=Actinomadura sp. 9N215 TaxID=3375150 RepID=UPI0037BAEC0E
MALLVDSRVGRCSCPLDNVIEAGDRVVVTARTQTTSAVCHHCGTPAARRHSRYRRRLHDLAAGGRPVLIVLEVSRFFCDNNACERRTFAEQVSVVTRWHSRRAGVAAPAAGTARPGLGGPGGQGGRTAGGPDQLVEWVGTTAAY